MGSYESESTQGVHRESRGPRLAQGGSPTLSEGKSVFGPVALVTQIRGSTTLCYFCSAFSMHSVAVDRDLPYK